MPTDRVFRRLRSTPHKASRSQRQKNRSSPALKQAIVLAVGLGLLVALIVVTRPQLHLPTIQTIDCRQVDTQPCSTAVMQALQPLLGQPLLFSDLQKTAQVLLSPAGVSLVDFTRIIPSTLHLTVKPLDVLFYLEYQNKTVAIASNGTLTTAPNTLDLHLLQVRSNDPSTNQQLDTTARVPGWIVHLIHELNAFITTSQVRPTTLILESPYEFQLQLADQPLLVVLNPQESTLNLARLSSILKSDQYMAMASPGATLDVRFRLPVLRR